MEVIGDKSVVLTINMKYFAFTYIRLKIFFLIGYGLLCSLYSKAQTDPTHKFLYVHTVSDGPDNSTNDEENETVTDIYQYKRPLPHLYKCIYADFGTSILNSTANGVTNTANGLTLALCGQVAS